MPILLAVYVWTVPVVVALIVLPDLLGQRQLCKRLVPRWPDPARRTPRRHRQGDGLSMLAAVPASAHAVGEFSLPDESEASFAAAVASSEAPKMRGSLPTITWLSGTDIRAQLDRIVGLRQPHRSNKGHMLVPIADAAREETPVPQKPTIWPELRSACMSAKRTGRWKSPACHRRRTHRVPLQVLP